MRRFLYGFKGAPSARPFGRKPYGAPSCRARWPLVTGRTRSCRIDPIPRPAARIRPSTSRQLRHRQKSHRGRNAMHCLGRPLQFQLCFASRKRDTPSARPRPAASTAPAGLTARAWPRPGPKRTRRTSRGDRCEMTFAIAKALPQPTTPRKDLRNRADPSSRKTDYGLLTWLPPET